MDPTDQLADLDPAQRQAVTTESTLVAVIAGAGSGKTRVLTRRIAYRIATETATADHTLVLTFTREAAGELRRRLPVLGVRQQVTAGTFHSVCRRLLHQYWEDKDRRPPTLRSDRRRILAEAVPSIEFEAIADEIDFAASRGWNSVAYTDAVRSGKHQPGADLGLVVGAMDAYRSLKRSRNIVDLDDLLTETVALIDTDEQFASVVRWRFRHLLVDEAQDLNPVQQRLIDLLRVGNDDLFLVGDPSQAIYGFNGADAGLLRDVGRHFPGVEVIRLPTNHRSTPQVVQAGTHVLDVAQQPSDVVSGREPGPIVEVLEAKDESYEAAQIAAAIEAMDPVIVRRGDVAVLARTHAALEQTRRELTARGLPMLYRADGVGSVYAAHLRQIYRLATIDQIRAWVQDHAEVADETGDEALGSVVGAVLAFLREQPTGGGAEFEQWVDSSNPLGESSAGVELLTFHAAKGREWNTVHLIGVETGLVPHRSATTKPAKDEEARLLYVAITRATDRLIIHHTERRGGYQRKLTPLLDGFVSAGPEVVPPPAMFIAQPADARSDRRIALEAWRSRAARGAGILPTQLLTDAQLAQIVAHDPRTADELDQLLGLGRLTAASLFDGIGAALSRDR